MFKSFLKLLSTKQVAELLIYIAKSLAKRTDNTIDDQLIEALERALKGEDYGLQRKARLAANAKTKKA